MMFTPGLLIEAVLAALLVITIGYCFVLNGKLNRLRSAQDELRQISHELATATENAEAAIRGLKATTDEADRKLSDKLNKARLLVRELSGFVELARPADDMGQRSHLRKAG